MSPQFFSGNQNHRSIKPVVLTMLFENFSTNSLNFYAILFYIIYKLGFETLKPLPFYCFENVQSLFTFDFVCTPNTNR